MEIEIKRKVKKEIEETVKMELKPFWNVRIIRPNGTNTYLCAYEQVFNYEPTEQEIASVLNEHSHFSNEFASVCKNYRLVELCTVSDNPYQE